MPRYCGPLFAYELFFLQNVIYYFKASVASADDMLKP